MNEYRGYRDYRTSSRSSNYEPTELRNWKRKHTWKKNTFYW